MGGKFTFKHPYVGVMSASGLKNRYLIVSLHHQQQFGIYPWTKVALWELQDPAPYTKGPGKSPAHPSGNRHTDHIPAVDPAWPMNWLQPLLATSREPLENTVLDNHPQTREPLRKSRFPAEKCQHTTGTKKCKLGHIGDGSY